MSAHAPTHPTPEAAATPVAAETSSTPTHPKPEAAHPTPGDVSETQEKTAGAAKHAAEVPAEHPKDHPADHEENHEEGHDKTEAAPHAAPHATPAAHPGHKLLIPRLEVDDWKKVSREAAKGAWTIITLPVSIPYVAGRLVVGTLYATGGKIYDAGAWVGHKAKSYWKHDKFYIPTATKAVGSAIVWPFKKVWQGTKWTGRKIKGLFTKSKEPEVTLPTHEATSAAHTTPTPAAPAATPAHPPEPTHTTPPASAPAAPAAAHPATPAPAAAAHTPPAHH